jgi:hypothetical protein
VARNRYIDRRCSEYNVTIRSFPSNLTAMIFKYQAKPNFTVENEAAIAKPPTVDFSKCFQTRRAARGVVIPRKRRATPYESILSATLRGRSGFVQGGVASPSCTSSTHRSSRLALYKTGHGRIDVLSAYRPS